MSDFFTPIGKWLLSIFEAIAQWFFDLIQSFAQWVYDGILSALATLLESIPVPSFFYSIAGYVSSISCEIVYLIDPFNFGTGMSWIIAAYIVRWIIRRLPIIG